MLVLVATPTCHQTFTGKDGEHDEHEPSQDNSIDDKQIKCSSKQTMIEEYNSTEPQNNANLPLTP